MKTFPAFVLLAMLLAGPQPSATTATVTSTAQVAVNNPKLAITHIAFTPAAQKKLNTIELKYLTRFFQQLLAEAASVTVIEEQLTIALKKLGVAAHTYQQVDGTSLLIDIQKITPLVLALEIRHNNLYSQVYWEPLLKKLLGNQNIQEGKRLPLDVERILKRITVYLQDDEKWRKEDIPLPRAGGLGSKISFYLLPYDDEAGGRVILQVHLDDKKTTHITSKNVIFDGNHKITRDAIIADIFKPLSLTATVWPQSIQYYYQKNLLPALKDFYRKHGYVEMEVVEEKFIQDSLSSEPKYLISINEGPQYTAQKLLFSDLSQAQNKLSKAESHHIQQIITAIPAQYAVTPFQDTFAKLVSAKITEYLEEQNRIGNQVYVQQLVDQPTKSMQCVINIRAGMQAPIIQDVDFRGEKINLIQARANFNIKVGQPYQKMQLLEEMSKLRDKNAIKQAEYLTVIRADNTLQVVVILTPFQLGEQIALNGSLQINNNAGRLIGYYQDRNLLYSNLPLTLQIDWRDVKPLNILNVTPNIHIDLITAVPTFLAVPLKVYVNASLQKTKGQISYGAEQQFFLNSFWNWTISGSSTWSRPSGPSAFSMITGIGMKDYQVKKLGSKIAFDTSRKYQDSLVLKTAGYNLSGTNSWCYLESSEQYKPYLENTINYRHYYALNNRVVAYLLGNVRQVLSPSQSQLPLSALEENMLVLPGFTRDKVAANNVILSHRNPGKQPNLGNDNAAKFGINLQFPCSGNFREMASASNAYVTLFLATSANIYLQRNMLLVQQAAFSGRNQSIFQNNRTSCGLFLSFGNVPWIGLIRFGFAMPLMGEKNKTPSFQVDFGVEDSSVF